MGPVAAADGNRAGVGVFRPCGSLAAAPARRFDPGSMGRRHSLQRLRELDGLAPRAMAKISDITDGAWLLATSSDREWPETTGSDENRSLADRFGSWYIDKFLDALAYDNTLRLAFVDVNQLVKPASSLFAPGLMLRVFRQTWGPRSGSN